MMKRIKPLTDESIISWADTQPKKEEEDRKHAHSKNVKLVFELKLPEICSYFSPLEIAYLRCVCKGWNVQISANTTLLIKIQQTCEVFGIRRAAVTKSKNSAKKKHEEIFECAVIGIIDIVKDFYFTGTDPNTLIFLMGIAKSMIPSLSSQASAWAKIIDVEVLYDLSGAKKTLQIIPSNEDYCDALESIIRKEIAEGLLENVKEDLALLKNLSKTGVYAKNKYIDISFFFLQERALVNPIDAEKMILALPPNLQKTSGLNIVACKVAIIQGYAKFNLKKAEEVLHSINDFYGISYFQTQAFCALAKGCYENSYFENGDKYLEKAKSVVDQISLEEPIYRFCGLVDILEVYYNHFPSQAKEKLLEVCELKESEKIYEYKLEASYFKKTLEMFTILEQNIKLL